MDGYRSAVAERDGPIVWIIDAEQWPRALLRAQLIEHGYDAIGFVRLRHALLALKLGPPAYPAPRAIVIDVVGQGASADDLGRLAAAGVPLIAIAGAVERADPAVAAAPWAALLPRPVTLGAIEDAVAHIVPTASR